MLCGLSIGGLFAAQSWLAGLPKIETAGLVLINTLRRDGPRLRWIGDALVRCAEVGGLEFFRDLYITLLFNEDWHDENRDKFLTPTPYTPLTKKNGHYNLLKNASSADWDLPYEQLTLPVQVITGLQDRVFLDHHDLEHLYKRLPDARHIKFVDAAHLLPAERPVELTETLLEFAQEVSS
jgi:3-oxoadipate enol-lactonase